jgi:Bacteriophage Lambda NinG protein.
MIRAAIQRTAPDARPKPAKGPRTRKCAHRGCLHRYVPDPGRPQVTWCSLDCAALIAIAAGAARKAKLQKVDRAVTKVKREALKTRQDWLKEAQAAFNAFIRERDAAQPCISCGRFHDGSYDAGHYRSVGAQPALRFDETNCHKQCVPCNQHKGGNVVEYRLRLLGKIGPEAVALLEIEHEPAKYTIEDAQRIKSVYKAKLKSMKEQVCPT